MGKCKSNALNGSNNKTFRRAQKKKKILEDLIHIFQSTTRKLQILMSKY